MFRYRCLAVFLVMVLLFVRPVRAESTVYGDTADGLKEEALYAKSAVLMDGSSGRVLYGKEADQRLPMASTTKIMTCILALEYADLDMECEFSHNASAAPKVKLGAAAGRRFLLEDLLYSLMLESHNDTAVAVAEAVAGSVEGFAALMNRKAEEIGLYDTSFVTPNGLDADGHYTTARDLAFLLRYCVTESPKKKEFLSVTGRQSYTFSDLDGACTYTVSNHNAFLTMMDGALTGKTGFTGKAGYCYVGALERDGKLFVVSLLACGWPNNRTYKWHDTKLLMNYGLGQYQVTERKLETGLPRKIPVSGGVYDWTEESGAYVTLETECPKSVRYLTRAGESIEVKVQLVKELIAPVRAGEEAGRVQIWIGSDCMEEYPITMKESVEKIDWMWYLRQIADFYFLFGG